MAEEVHGEVVAEGEEVQEAAANIRRILASASRQYMSMSGSGSGAPPVVTT